MTPKTGPSEGSRSASVTFLPSFAMACARPTEVVALPSPAGVRRYRGDEDEFTVLVVFHLFPEVEGDLRLVFSVELEVVGVYVETLGDFGNRFHLSLLRYFDIA